MAELTGARLFVRPAETGGLMKTYPEMNEKIVELLLISDNPVSLYAAHRIEELEQAIRHIPLGRIYCIQCNEYDNNCGCNPSVVERTRKAYLQLRIE